MTGLCDKGLTRRCGASSASRPAVQPAPDAVGPGEHPAAADRGPQGRPGSASTPSSRPWAALAGPPAGSALLGGQQQRVARGGGWCRVAGGHLRRRADRQPRLPFRGGTGAPRRSLQRFGQTVANAVPRPQRRPRRRPGDLPRRCRGRSTSCVPDRRGRAGDDQAAGYLGRVGEVMIRATLSWLSSASPLHPVGAGGRPRRVRRCCSRRDAEPLTSFHRHLRRHQRRHLLPRRSGRASSTTASGSRSSTIAAEVYGSVVDGVASATGAAFADGARLIGSGRPGLLHRAAALRGGLALACSWLGPRQGRVDRLDLIASRCPGQGRNVEAWRRAGEGLPRQPRKTFTIVGIFGFPGGADIEGGASSPCSRCWWPRKSTPGETGVYSNVDVKAAPGVSDDQLRRRGDLGSGYTVKTGKQLAQRKASSLQQVLKFFNHILIGFASVGLFAAVFLVRTRSQRSWPRAHPGAGADAGDRASRLQAYRLVARCWRPSSSAWLAALGTASWAWVRCWPRSSPASARAPARHRASRRPRGSARSRSASASRSSPAPSACGWPRSRPSPRCATPPHRTVR